jgi:hypothetical protein
LEISSGSSHVLSKSSNYFEGIFYLTVLRNGQKQDGDEERTVNWRMEEGVAVSVTKRVATEHDKISNSKNRRILEQSQQS